MENLNTKQINNKNMILDLHMLEIVRIFVVRHFYINIWFVDFLCPQISYCLRYKQRFLRAYSPTSQYESVATWRNSLLSLFINF